MLAGIQIPPNYGPTYTQALANVYPELAARFDAALIDFILADVALNRELMQPDGIHPNAAGQKIVFANVWRVLGPLLSRAMPLKPWLAAYSPGVPAEIDPDRYPSLVALLEASFARFAAQPAFTNLDTTLTFADVERSSRAFAAYLQALPGARAGDRVAIMMPNTLQSPVVLFGILRAGMVAVNVNPQYTVPELEHQLADSGAHAVVVLENFAHTVAAALARTAVKNVDRDAARRSLLAAEARRSSTSSSST